VKRGVVKEEKRRKEKIKLKYYLGENKVSAHEE
jgi:hypothetical protein